MRGGGNGPAMRGLAVMALLALASCHRADNADRARLDDLSARVTALEQRELRLQQALRERQGPTAQATGEAATMWAFEETPGGSHRYATRERCEAALQAFEADRAAEDAAKGVTVVRGTEPSCNPV